MRALLVLLTLLCACRDVHNTYYGIERDPPQDAESPTPSDAAVAPGREKDSAIEILPEDSDASVNPREDAAVQDAAPVVTSTFTTGYRVMREMTETCDRPSKLTEMFWDVRTGVGGVSIDVSLTEAGGQLLYTELSGGLPTEAFELSGPLVDEPMLSVTITGGFTTATGGFEAEEKSGPVGQTICGGWITRRLVGTPF